MGCCNSNDAAEEAETSSSSAATSPAIADSSKAGADGSPAPSAASSSVDNPAAASFTANELASAPADPLCYIWGDNQFGQMGDGSLSASTGVERPRNVVMFKKKRQPVDTSVGNGHICLVTKEGQLFAWGKNDKGQCGNGSTSTSGLTRPVRSSFFFKAPAKKVISVACGGDFSLALTSDGKVYGFGGNAKGQLGLSNTQASVTTPTALPLSYIKQIVAGESHAAAVNSAQKLFLFGSNEFKQLGAMPATQPKPTEWAGKEKVASVACGDKCTAIVTPAGACLFAGQVGEGIATMAVFGQPARMKGKNVVQVSAGAQHALILTKAGKVFVWGSGWATGCEAAGAPAGMKTSCAEPEEMAGIGGKVIQVAAGKYHSLALLEKDGLCYAWGRHGRSQLGIGMNMSTGIKKPCMVRPVVAKGKLPYFYKVIAGGDSTIALADNAKSVAPADLAALNMDTFADVTAGAVSSDQALDKESYDVVDALKSLKQSGKSDLADGSTSDTKTEGDTPMTIELGIAANMTRQAQETGVADARATDTVMDDLGMDMSAGPAMPAGPPPPEDDE